MVHQAVRVMLGRDRAFAHQGIRVSAVAPAVIDTDMVERMAGKGGEGRTWLLSLHPAGRFGVSEEIAAALL